MSFKKKAGTALTLTALVASSLQARLEQFPVYSLIQDSTGKYLVSIIEKNDKFFVGDTNYIVIGDSVKPTDHKPELPDDARKVISVFLVVQRYGKPFEGGYPDTESNKVDFGKYKVIAHNCNERPYIDKGKFPPLDKLGALQGYGNYGWDFIRDDGLNLEYDEQDGMDFVRRGVDKFLNIRGRRLWEKVAREKFDNLLYIFWEKGLKQIQKTLPAMRYQGNR